MRDILILTLIIAAVIFLAPMIVSMIIFLLCAAVIVILLARLGFLPGFRYVRYGNAPREGKSSRKWKWKYPGRGGKDSDNDRTERGTGSGWYHSSQQGEEITLPETALRKEDDQTKNGV